LKGGDRVGGTHESPETRGRGRNTKNESILSTRHKNTSVEVGASQFFKKKKVPEGRIVGAILSTWKG